MMESTSLDRLDRALLRAVQRDARQNLQQLADACATSPSSATRRLQRLEREGVITGYRAQVDPAKLGLSQDIFVELSLTSQDQASMESFEQAIKQVPQVQSCWLMAGDFDYLIHVLAANPRDYERLHRQLSELPHVMRLKSSFALRRLMDRDISGD